jgi:hypothetical protein
MIESEIITNNKINMFHWSFVFIRQLNLQNKVIFRNSQIKTPTKDF